MKHLAYLNKYFVKYKYRFLAGIVFVVVSNVFGLLPPRLLRFGIDLVADNIRVFRLFNDFDLQSSFHFYFTLLLLVVGASILFMALIKGLFMFFMRQTIIVMSRLIEYDLKNEIYAHYQVLSTAFYKRNNTGDLMSRATEDVSRVRMYLGPAVMYAINLAALFILVIWTMFKVNAYLTFFVLLPLPLLSYSIYKVSSTINRRSEIIQGRLSGLTSFSQEIFSGIRVIKSYVREKDTLEDFDKECEEYKSESLKLAKVEAFFAPLMLLLIGLSTILTVYIGGIEVSRGRFTPGNIAEFVFYINMLTWPVASLGWVASLVQRASASQKRINDFLLTRPEIVDGHGQPVDGLGDIVLDKVSFTYPDTGIEAIRDVSLQISKKEKVAIVGKTGSGKSTLAELIVRTYDPGSGDILVNGVHLSDLPVSELRRRIGYVPQDVFLFSDTVENNIRFGKEDATITEIREAASLASIDKEIMALAKDYKTRVGERGVTLSGGQKQRISIARALVKDPELVILDDCLSAVDAGTEEEILLNFGKALKDKTVIFITHRIFSLMEFDRIYVLDEGRLAESGTHEELLHKRGLYYELYQAQQLEQQSAV